jgi:hypothetical protein
MAMAFDVNPGTGNIDITPLVSYETAMFADEFCVFRLVLARREDALGTGSLVVQTSMTAVQAETLVVDLQKMLERIYAARANATRQ